MNILMLTPYLPYPPNSGGQIRTFNLLKNLSQEHSITLVCLYKNEAEKAHAAALEPFCAAVHLCKRPEKPWQISNVLKAVFGPLPFLIVRNYSSEAAATVERLLHTQHFDVIHAETFYVMPHIPTTSIPILLVEQTLEYRVYKHYISKLPWFLHHPLRIDTFKLKFWESYYWKRAQLVAAVSEADAVAIRTLSKGVRPVVIPNGATDEMFATQKEASQITVHKENTILFVGNFAWLQNTEAAGFLLDEVTPLLHELKKKVHIIIAGQGIPLSFKKQKPNYVTFVDLTDASNEFVQKLYQSAAVFAAPIFGPGGTRLKILTAMASRVPVVTTKTGAEGLFLEDEKSVLLAEDARSFAEKLARLLDDESLQNAIADSAYQSALNHFSWKSITKSLVEAYKTIIA